VYNHRIQLTNFYTLVESHFMLLQTLTYHMDVSYGGAWS
jgi:hypothetical protein